MDESLAETVSGVPVDLPGAMELPGDPTTALPMDAGTE
jgi:hypothetical protein